MTRSNEAQNGADIADAIRANAAAAGVPDWIAADPATVSPVLRAPQAFLRAQCDHWSGLTPALGAFAGQFMNDMCGPYLGPDGTPVYAPTSPPFSGGQCPGELYRVFLDRSGTFGTVQQERVSPGPIGGVQRRPNNEAGTSFTWFYPDGSPDGEEVLNVQSPESESYVITSVAPFDGGPDECGDPPAPPPGFDPPANPRPVPPPTIPYTPPGGGPTIPISLTGPSVDANGGLSLTGNIGPITIDLGGLAGTGPPPAGSSPSLPDYGEPSAPEAPNPGGGPGEPGNPPDGVDFDGAVAAVTVLVTEESSGSGREVGGPENIFIDGYLFDAGWFRWKVAGGFSPEIRITSRSETFVYSVGVCQEAEGYQIKFSDGFSGNAVSYICQE